MYPKRTNTTLKVFLSYFVLAILVVTAGWFIYNESVVLNNQDTTSEESEKLLKISSLLAYIYENENLAKATLISTTKKDFDNYTHEVFKIVSEIDTIKLSVSNKFQSQQLDSIAFLLKRKHSNIKELRRIKINNEIDVSFKIGIEELTKMESSLGKITIDHLIKEPEKLESYQRAVIDKLVVILNDNLPEDSNEISDKKTVDSVVTASKSLLKELRAEAESAQNALKAKEVELLKNDFTISEQLRRIITNIESEILLNALQNDIARKAAEKKTAQIITYAGVLGFLLVIIFSFLILSDFWKSQSYRKQLEASKNYAESILDSREQLIRMVSHDLKTPLSAIVSYSDLLTHSPINNEQETYISQLKNSATYITKLVDDLLAFSKLESGKLYLHKNPFHLKSLIEETAQAIHQIYQEKPIDFQLTIASDLNDITFLGDPLRIKQVVSNLLNNAFKFTHQGNITLKVVAEAIEDHSFLIKIIVTDTGIGIPENKQQLIFKEFSRANSNVKENYEGSGLGLTISKKLAIAMKGDILLASKEGEGSAFSFQLPLEKTNEKTPAESSYEKRFKTHTKINAVVIDDNDTLRKLMKEILRKWDVNVFDFENASIALKKLPSIPYSIIFTDIQMPQMDGYTFVKKLKKSPHYRYQPIIAISGALEDEFLTTDFEIFSGFIKKPFQPKDIINCLKKYFDNDAELTDNARTNNLLKNKRYDLSELINFMQNDQDLVYEILETFLKNTVEDVVQIKNSFQDKDLKMIRKIAHRMKPMYQQINAHEVVSLLDELESLKDITGANNKIVSQLEVSIIDLKQDLSDQIIS